MNNVLELKLKDVVPSKFNPRKHFDDKKMADLVLSIKEKGVIQPIIVRKQGQVHEIVCGERRYRASQKAGKETIPAMVRDLSDNQVLEFQVIENLQREDVHPLEEAEGYEILLKNHGYKTVDDIAAKVGKSRTYIYGRLKLCELIPENRKLFYDDKFSPSVALLVARIPAGLQKAAAKELLDRVDDGDTVSYREAHRCIERDFMLQLKEAPFDPKDATLKTGSCTKCEKRTGNQKELFPDISSADVCTDPLCFNMKKNAFIQKTLAQAKTSGKTVLSVDECKKIFPYEYDTDPKGGYVSLDHTCYADSKSRKYSQLIQGVKDADIIYAVHPAKMRLVKLLKDTEASRILKQLGIKSRDSSSGPAKDISKVKTENRVRETKRKFWIGKVSTAKDRRCMNVIILSILLQDMGYMSAEETAGADWSITKLYNRGDEEVQKLIAKIVAVKPEVLDDEELEFLSTKLGFGMAKDYVITEDYLQSMTKDQLAKLDKELGIGGEAKDGWKKDALVAFILKHAPKGKVPKELVK